MNNRFILALMGYVLFALAQQTHAQSWQLYLKAEKNLQGANGLIFPFIRHAETLNGNKLFYGNADKATLYAPNGNSLGIANDPNTFKVFGNIIATAGKLMFSNKLSSVLFHSVLYGSQYIGVERLETHGQLSSDKFLKLNTSTNQYEPVSSLQFDGPVTGFADLGNSKVLIWGTFYSAKASNKLLSNVATVIWDMAADSITKPCSSDGACGIYSSGGNQQSISSVDGTAMILHTTGYGFFIVRTGYMGWGGDQYPNLPSGGRFVTCHVVDKNTIYAAWQKDSITYPTYLMKLNGDQWQALARFSNPNASTQKDLNKINSIRKLDGKLYLIGNWKQVNGVAMSGAITYDLTTGVVVNLPSLPVSDFNQAWLEILDNKPYFFDGSSLAAGEQRVYVLENDITPPSAPSIIGPTGAIDGRVLADSGYAEAYSLVKYYFNNVNSHQIPTDGTGKWRVSFLDLPEGMYARYATAQDAAGNISAPSQTLTVLVDKTPPVAPALKTPTASYVGKRNVNVQFVTGDLSADSKAVVFLIYKDGSSVPLYVDTITALVGGATLNKIFSDTGKYEWSAYAIDRAGNISSLPARRLFIIASDGSVQDPSNPPPVILYPNPVQSQGTVQFKNIKEVLMVSDYMGRRCIAPFTKLSDSIRLQAPIAAGMYIVLVKDLQGKQQSLKLMVR